jgi:hypothetical protein
VKKGKKPPPKVDKTLLCKGCGHNMGHSRAKGWEEHEDGTLTAVVRCGKCKLEHTVKIRFKEDGA